MRPRTLLAAMASALAAFALAAVPAVAAGTPTTAPPSCQVLNPLFEWNAGQERTLKAADKNCNTVRGKRAWLIFQSNGNLSFYLDGRQLWSSGTKGRGDRLIERGNGSLELVGPTGQVLWAIEAPSSSAYEPHPNGGYSTGFMSEDSNENWTHWTLDEGLCGAQGGCGASLWVSGEGLT